MEWWRQKPNWKESKWGRGQNVVTSFEMFYCKSEQWNGAVDRGRYKGQVLKRWKILKHGLHAGRNYPM